MTHFVLSTHRCWLGLAILGMACGGKSVEVFELPDDQDASGVSPPLEDGTCWEPSDCEASEVCHPDGLCHPWPSSCGEESCAMRGDGDCVCTWSCSDEHEYQSLCRTTETGFVTCNCVVDEEEFDWVCVVEEPVSDVCGMREPCCGFPE